MGINYAIYMIPKTYTSWHLCALFSSFPFKPNIFLLMLHFIHIKCLEIQYFQSNFEH